MLTLPIIHSNGTSKERLIEGLMEASSALTIAEKTLLQTAPNARDYYLVPGLLQKAEAEHYVRLQKLISVRKEIDELIDGIDTL